MADHVLVAVDGSEESDAALDHALAEHADAEITVVHVVTPPNSVEFADEEYFDADAYEQLAEERRNRGDRILDEARQRAATEGIEIETVSVAGRPAAEILAAVEREGADHVVVGSRGRSGVGRVLFGSVAESVTRRSSVPVTVVR